MRSRRPRHHGHRLAAASLAATLALTATACDDAPRTGSDGPSGSSPTSSGSAASTSASEDAVEPATGPLVEMQNYTYRLLDEGLIATDDPSDPDADKGWGPITSNRFSYSVGYRTTRGYAEVIGTSSQQFFTTLDQRSLTEKIDADAALQLDDLPADATRRPDRRINDVDAWVFTATRNDLGDDLSRVYRVGGIRGDFAWSLEFTYYDGWPDAEQRIDSMLASITWLDTPLPIATPTPAG